MVGQDTDLSKIQKPSTAPFYGGSEQQMKKSENFVGSWYVCARLLQRLLSKNIEGF
jgi:hypothetical protein